MADNIDTLREQLSDALTMLHLLTQINRDARHQMAAMLSELSDNLGGALAEVDDLLLAISAERLRLERQDNDTDLRE